MCRDIYFSLSVHNGCYIWVIILVILISLYIFPVSKFSAVCMHDLCESVSEVSAELKFLIILTSILKAEFFTLKRRRRKRKD